MRIKEMNIRLLKNKKFCIMNNNISLFIPYTLIYYIIEIV